MLQTISRNTGNSSYLDAINDNEWPACCSVIRHLSSLIDSFSRKFIEPDIFSTWFGKIRLDVKLFNDFNLAIEIPYLFEIAHTDSPGFTV